MITADIEKAYAMILLLLANKAVDATLCPGEAARALAVTNISMEWRTVRVTNSRDINQELSFLYHRLPN